MFDNLKGIRQGNAAVQAGNRAGLEKLIEVEKEFTGPYGRRGRFDIRIYTPHLLMLQEKLDGVILTESDLQDFVMYKSNNGYQAKQSRVLGMMTGLLLDLITQQKQAEEEPCRIRIRGNGQRFDHLFSYARNVDELTVEGFTGDNICRYVGAVSGHIGKLVLKNIKGDNTATGVCSQGGSAGTVVLTGCEGNQLARDAGNWEGEIGALILAGNKGHSVGQGVLSNKGKGRLVMIVGNDGPRAGYSMANFKGDVKMVVVADSKGDDIALHSAAQEGRIDLLAATENTGDVAGQVASSGYANLIFIEKCLGNHAIGAGRNGGMANVVVLDGNGLPCLDTYVTASGMSYALIWANNSTVYPERLSISRNTIAKIYIPQDVDIKCDSLSGEIITGAEAIKAHANMLRLYRLKEITGLAKAVESYEPEHLMETADKLMAVYDSIKGLLEQGNQG